MTEEESEKLINHGRGAAQWPHILTIDIRAFVPLLATLLIHAMWMVYLSVASVLFFLVLQRFGFTLPVFFRWIRHRMSGSVRRARSLWYWRRFR
jgi:intracellular multiplication protein IcmT